MKRGRILILDDEADLRKLVQQLIKPQDYQVWDTGDYREAIELVEKEEIDVVLCDVMLGNVNGIDLIPEFQQKSSVVQIIMMTAYGSIEDGVKAMRQGAFDYLTKGDTDSQIIPTIERALDKVRMQQRIIHLESALEQKSGFEALVGESSVLKQAVEVAKKVAVVDTPVLLFGETGTGKEVFARSLHQASNRKGGPFVAVNCSAFARNLLESEMFGYRAGAFTGADKNKKGLFEEAHGGTLFLDEIGEMDIELQAKILRAIETQSFIKAGATKPTTVDVRIIAASNRELEKAIQEGLFREDLYFRIAVMKIELPALRERPDDLPALCEAFVKEFSTAMKLNVTKIEPQIIERLKKYHFPGNIRELRNIIERALILNDGPVLKVKNLPPEIDRTAMSPVPANDSDVRTLAEAEEKHIRRILDACDGNKRRAAEILDIGEATLYRKIKTYQI